MPEIVPVTDVPKGPCDQPQPTPPPTFGRGGDVPSAQSRTATTSDRMLLPSPAAGRCPPQEPSSSVATADQDLEVAGDESAALVRPALGVVSTQALGQVLQPEPEESPCRASGGGVALAPSCRDGSR